MEENTKFCKFCGEKIPENAVVCTHCGRQVEELKSNSASPIVINNSNNNSNVNVNKNTNINSNYHRHGTPKSKWVSFFLCLFLGFLGAHKFYEGKIGMGILYLFTGGLFVIGWIVDCISILSKPDPYYI